MGENDVKAAQVTTIKSRTNHGELTKQVVRLLEIEGRDSVVHITRTTLVEDAEAFQWYMERGFAKVREFRGKVVVQQRVSIKVDTLEKIMTCLKGLPK